VIQGDKKINVPESGYYDIFRTVTILKWATNVIDEVEINQIVAW